MISVDLIPFVELGNIVTTKSSPRSTRPRSSLCLSQDPSPSRSLVDRRGRQRGSAPRSRTPFQPKAVPLRCDVSPLARPDRSSRLLILTDQPPGSTRTHSTPGRLGASAPHAQHGGLPRYEGICASPLGDSKNFCDPRDNCCCLLTPSALAGRGTAHPWTAAPAPAPDPGSRTTGLEAASLFLIW
jgi:hypothetical protein